MTLQFEFEEEYAVKQIRGTDIQNVKRQISQMYYEGKSLEDIFAEVSLPDLTVGEIVNVYAFSYLMLEDDDIYRFSDVDTVCDLADDCITDVENVIAYIQTKY